LSQDAIELCPTTDVGFIPQTEGLVTGVAILIGVMAAREKWFALRKRLDATVTPTWFPCCAVTETLTTIKNG
jgi:hypothetical protein